MAKTTTDNLELVLLNDEGSSNVLPDLQDNLNKINEGDKARQADIAAERTRAQTAEGTNAAAITAEAATRASADATHAGTTTSVHGITNTAQLVYTTDSRLADQRPPPDGSVVTAKLADGAVTSQKTDSVVQAALAAASVSASITALGNEVSRATAAEATKAPALIAGAVRTSSGNLTANELARIDTTTSPLSFVLPTTPADKTRIGAKIVIQGGANTATITCGGSDVFNKPGGGTALTLYLLNQGVMLEYHSGTTSWVVVADDLPLGQLDTRYAPAITVKQAQQFRTAGDQSQLLAQVTPPAFATNVGLAANQITVYPGERYQDIVGFGAAMTDAAAYCLMTYLTSSQRSSLLQELFDPSQCGWSTLRIGLGSTDFQQGSAYSYEPIPSGSVDPNLVQFDISKDAIRIIPVIQQILTINPRVRIFASVWTPPGWLVSGQLIGNSTVAGSNLTQMQVYANYLVKAIQAYQSYGIPIWAICPVNEPGGQSGTAANLNTFIGTYLGPAFDAAGITTRILAADDSWNQGDAIATPQLSDATAGPYLDGVAWHAYGGTPAQMGKTQRLFPTKSQYLTEMRTLQSENWTTSQTIVAGDLIVGALRNWAKAVTMWNLALDQTGNPNNGSTPGRRGVITIQNDSSGTITRNAEYYTLTHCAKFIKPGAVRINSTSYAVGKAQSGLQSVAFLNPDQSIVLFVYNSSLSAIQTYVSDARTNQGFPVQIGAGDVSTIVWGAVSSLTPISSAATPSVPAAPVVSATGSAGQVTLTWSTPASPSAPISGYTLSRSTTTGTETYLTTLLPSATSYTDVTNAAGTWFYKLAALNAGGSGAQSAEVSATATSPAAPAAPTLVSVTPGDQQATLTFTVDKSAAPVSGINVTRGTTSGGESQLVTLPANQTTYTDTGLTNGTTYYYKVYATNGQGAAASAEKSATPPGAPTLDFVAAGATGNNVGSITWNHTIGAGSNRILIVSVANSGSSAFLNRPASVTFGGVAMTKMTGAEASSSSSSSRSMELWYLLNPTTSTAAVLVTMNNSTGLNIVGNSISYSDVSQATPNGTPAVATTTSASSLSTTALTTTVKDVVLSCIAVRNNDPAVGGAGTSRWDVAYTTSTYNRGATYVGVNGTVTPSFTWSVGDNGALVAVAIHGA